MYTAYLALFQAEAELEEELPYLWHKACCLGRKGSKGRGQRGRRELNMSPQPGHLLALTCTDDDLVSDIPSFSGKAYLFIPNVEASKLFKSEDGLTYNKKNFTSNE